MTEYVCFPLGSTTQGVQDIVSILNQMMPTVIQLVIIFGVLYMIKEILRR